MKLNLALFNSRHANSELLHRNRLREEVYSQVCRALTNYEAADKHGIHDMYEALCHIQVHWDELMAEFGD